MLRQLSELEAALQQMVAEHRKLLAFVDAQQAAMRKMDLAAMDVAVNAQEACRLRIATLETKRKTLVLFLTRGQKLEGPGGPPNAKSAIRNPQSAIGNPPVTLSQLAALYPQRRDPLLKLGAELKQIAAQVAGRTKVAGKLAGAVLGHLNTVVRLLAGAVERAPGVYTKDGVPRVSARIGIMEAVA
jgi:hypothetical protein